MDTQLTAVNENSSLQGTWTPKEVLAQMTAIQQLLSDAMKKDEHYGIIPGTTKPTLLKAGAEKLSLMFRLSPTYEIIKTEHSNGHREYYVTCTLTSINSGKIIGQGVGSCSTLESKYRWRNSEKKCPKCGKETIIKGKEEYGGGWLCYAKKGGCGAKFKQGDSEIESQESGKIENRDIADVYNTVLKMAKKRAHVDAILTATAASDLFTQDVEDLIDKGNQYTDVQDAKIVSEQKSENKDLNLATTAFSFFSQQIKEARGTDILKRLYDEMKNDDRLTSLQKEELATLCTTRKHELSPSK